MESLEELAQILERELKDARDLGDNEKATKKSKDLKLVRDTIENLSALRAKDYVKAEKGFKELLKIQPRNPIFLSSLGEIMTATNRPRSAAKLHHDAGALFGKEYLDKRLAPEELHEALMISGNAMIKIANYKEASDMFGIAVKFNPDNPDGWKRLGFCLSKQDMLEQSLYAYDKAYELDPKDSWLINNIANVYEQLKEFDSAMAYADEGIQNSDHNDHSKFIKSRILTIKGEISEANEVIESIKDNFVKAAAYATSARFRGETMTGIFYSLKALKEESGPAYDNNEISGIKGILEQNIYRGISHHIKNHGMEDLILNLKENKGEWSEYGKYILCSILEASGNNKEYIRQTQELFQDIIKKEADIEDIGVKSKNSVNIISKNLIAEKLYILKNTKESLSKNLEKEFCLTNLIRDYTSKCSQALCLDHNYMLEKRINKWSLDLLIPDMDSKEIDEELKKCIDTLSDFHYQIDLKKAPDGSFKIIYYMENEHKEVILPKYDLLAELDRRFIKRIERDGSSIVQKYSDLIKPLYFTENLIHADTHKGNWLEGGIIIDWDRASIGDPMIDLVQLINDVEFSNLERDELAREYMNKVSINPQKGMDKYKILCIHDSLCNIGTRVDRFRNSHDNKFADEANRYVIQSLEQTKPYPQFHRELISYLYSAGLIDNQ